MTPTLIIETGPGCEPTKVVALVAARKAAAESLEWLFGNAPTDEVGAEEYWRIIRGGMPPAPADPVAAACMEKQQALRGYRRLPNSITDVIEQCDRIIAYCERIPPEGDEFADSVMAKALSIKEYAETSAEITHLQQDALDNMEAGARKWVR